jgi:hypothetical protein
MAQGWLASECLAAAKEEGAAVKKEWILTRWQKLTKHSLTLDFNS